MTRRRAIAAAHAHALRGLVVWKRERVVPHALSPRSSTASPPHAEPQTQNSKPKTSSASVAASAPERSTLADALNSPATDIGADLRLVSNILETFRSNFPRAGNPTGTNAEITAVLTGKNQLRLELIPSDHPTINKDGELCDRWGTPFFFHAESATKMEIRSAGPDRKMWTADDVTFAP